MLSIIRTFRALFLPFLFSPAVACQSETLSPGADRAIVIAHRGASFAAPAHTTLHRIIVQSFDPSSLRRFETAAPGHRLILLIGAASAKSVRDSLSFIASLAHGIGPRQQSIDEALVAAAHDRCLVVHAYTVNDEQEMLSLLAMGVDGIFTDRPDALRRAVDGLAPTPRAGRCS